MAKPSKDPSVFAEPHLQDGDYEADPSEARAAETLAKAARSRGRLDRRVEHTVWEEPARTAELSGEPPTHAPTYARWLEEGAAATSRGQSWMVVVGIALCAGPLAVLGAFWGSGQSASSILALTIFGPAVEEMMKAALALYVVEKRPFLFKEPAQIFLAMGAAGLAFAAIENLIYLNVYVDTPSASLFAWRWTVCVALHVGCCLITAAGLARIWRSTWMMREPPDLGKGNAFITTAVVVHGLYNGLALLEASAGYGF